MFFLLLSCTNPSITNVNECKLFDIFNGTKGNRSLISGDPLRQAT